MNPLLRPLDVGWTFTRSLVGPPVHAVASWFTGIGHALLPVGDVYDVVEPGPGGSYKVVSAHPSMNEAMIVMDSLLATRKDVSVMRDIDVQRHNRAAAMRVYRATTSGTYCGADAETVTMPEGPPVLPLPPLRPSPMPHGGEDDAAVFGATGTNPLAPRVVREAGLPDEDR